jgi:hypothetical protein
MTRLAWQKTEATPEAIETLKIRMAGERKKVWEGGIC